MEEIIKVGIIICDRYRRCAGGKCLRSMERKEGAFNIYDTATLKLVGYTTCDGCPGGNIEYAGEEMVNNGAQRIHLATGLVVGYPPCPYIKTFKDFLQERFHVEVIVGTHPIPQKYLDMHTHLGTWNTPTWKKLIKPTLSTEEIRIAYN